MIFESFKLLSLSFILIYLAGCTSYGVIDNPPIDDNNKANGYS